MGSFWMLCGSFEALQKPLGVFLTYQGPYMNIFALVVDYGVGGIQGERGGERRKEVNIYVPVVAYKQQKNKLGDIR